MNILLGTTGSVAASLTPRLVEALRVVGDVRVVATRSSTKFFDTSAVNRWPGSFFTDEDEERWVRGDRILHIELKKWADVLVVAPLCAHTMASFAAGLSGNLLTSVFRCWPVKDKSVIVAPAMNTDMWNHPVTTQNLVTLGGFFSRPARLEIVPPVEKTLACGDTGIGAMASIESIVAAVEARIVEDDLR